MSMRQVLPSIALALIAPLGCDQSASPGGASVATGGSGGGLPTAPATCTDGLQNQGEARVDCGGPCAACQVQPPPATPTCTDGLQNQGEAGVDCGGPCAACQVQPPPVGGTTRDLVAQTHADGWIEPDLTADAVVIGAWYDYHYPDAAACNPVLTRPAQRGGPICFSGQDCAGATAALGFNLCNLSNLDDSTWPQMQAFVASRALSTDANAVYGFGGCNPGKRITSFSWVGTLPAGTASFHNAADQVIGTAPFTAGATSLTIPAGIDGSQIGSIHFLFDGTAVTTWNFCISSLVIAYQ